MTAEEPPACLLRVAGLPAAVVAAAGAPELFERLRGHLRDEAAYRVLAQDVARRLGEELVPHPELPGPLRASAIALRRDLFHGAVVEDVRCRRLAVVGVALGAPEALTRDLVDVGERAAALAATWAGAVEEVRAERERLAGLPWELVTGSPSAERVVARTAPGLLEEVRERLAAGAGWDGKRMRQRADYLLRLLTRAAFKTTPRGWLGHVAVVGVSPGPARAGLAEVEVGDYATHWVSNIRDDRRALTEAAELPDAWLGVSGLHWVDDSRLCCWAPDPSGAGGLRLVRVRRTPAIDALLGVLGSGALRTPDVVALLAPDGDAHRRGVVRRFLRHLAQLGVVQVSAPPAARLREWAPTPREEAPPAGATGFVDVYRRTRDSLPAAAVDRLAELVAQAGRLAAVLAGGAGPRPPHPVLELVGPTPRSAAEIVAQFLDGREPRPLEWAPAAWPAPRPGTPYQLLCDWLGERAGEAEVDITAGVLDAVGAPPPAPPRWPVDCLVRPLPAGGPMAVLEAVTPAGVVDARFAEALGRLGRVPQVEAYRAFLAEVAARCGVEPLEVLAPPHGGQGANTVRRPRYTDAWTGDPDGATHLGGPPGRGRYLPLGRVLLSRRGGRVVAEDPSGRELWPLCHATRVPEPPWDVVLALLGAASPVTALAGPIAFGDPAPAFPGRTRTPRLLLDGGLVLAEASVRVPRAALPDPGAPVEARARELAALRATTGVPRWNFARVDGGRRPLPVDLDSLTALRRLDRLTADPAVSALVLTEMLPDPDGLSVRDAAGDRLAAQLLVRLPRAASPARSAEAVARARRGSAPAGPPVVAAS